MATKRTDLETDEFKLDDDLNFDDFDINEIDAQTNPELKRKKRTPVMDVFAGTIQGAKDRAQDPAFLAKVTKDTLPQQYGVVFDAADKIAGTATSLYDEAVREIKPQLSRISKKIDKLVPDEQKTLKKITSKLSSVFGDEDSSNYKGTSPEEIQEQSINNALGAIFQQNQANAERGEAYDYAQDQIQQTIETKRFKSNFGLLTSIEQATQRTAQYTERVNQAFQRKSLELQFRSYFVQSQLLDVSKRYYEIFKNQNEGIARNTALPEFVKINNSERFKDLARNKFFNNVQDSLFGADSALGQGLQRIKKDVISFIVGAKQGLEASMMGVDAVEQLKEQNKMLVEMGADPVTGANIAGAQAGGFLVDKASTLVSDKLRPILDKNPAISKFGNTLAEGITNLPGTIRRARDSKYMQEGLEDQGVKGKAFGFFDKFLDYFTDKRPDFQVDNKNNLNSLSQASIFDNRTQKSIIEIIPGYLARILRETTAIRTGDDKASLVQYDFTSGKFKDQAGIASSIKSLLSKRVKTSGFDYKLDKLLEVLDEEKEVTDDQKGLVKDFFAKISKIANMDYKPESIMNTDAFERGLDDDSKKLIKSLLENKVQSTSDTGQGQRELTAALSEVRRATPDLRGLFEQFIQLGYSDVLEKEGFIKNAAPKVTRLTDEELKKKTKAEQEKYKADLQREANETNESKFEIDEDKYHEFVRSESIATSDVNKKRNIKPLSKNKKSVIAKSDINAKQSIKPIRSRNTRKALKNINKTKVSSWKYKSGQGDDQEHIGPMAQDVNRIMGENAAPNGTSIDLVNLNGQNMAAIQALSEKQEELSSGDSSKSVLDRIKEDTGQMLEQMKLGSGSGTGDKSYKGILGRLFGDTGSLAAKTAGDIGKSGIEVAKFTKDKVIKPGAEFIKNRYENNKEGANKLLGQAWNKSTEMATKLLGSAQRMIFEHIPSVIGKGVNLINSAKDKIKEFLNSAKDVYIQGRSSPVLRATLLKAGYYRDKVTGKVLRTMDDLNDLKGDIVGPAGEVILSLQEAAEGLYDQTGNKIKTTFQKAMEFGTGMLAEGFQRAKKFWKGVGSFASDKAPKIADTLKGLLSKGKEGVLGKLKDFNFTTGFAFGNEKIYDVLVEIRGLMRGEDTPRHEDKNKSVTPKLDDTSKAKMPVKEVTETVSEEPQQASEFVGPVQPKYQSGSNIIDTIANKAPGIIDKAREIKDKAPGMLSSVKDKLSSTVGSIKEAKGFNNKRKAFKGAVLGGVTSLFSRNKKDKRASDDPSTFVGPSPELVGPVRPQEQASTQEASEQMSPPKPGLAKKAKQAITNVKDKVKGAVANSAIGKAIAPAFNDRDGSGRRDGSWLDRFDMMKKRQEERQAKKVEVASTDPKYKSDKNIIDTMLEKAGGVFDFLKSSAGSLISGIGGLLGMGGAAAGGGLLGKVVGLIGSVIKAPFKLAWGAMKGVGAVAGAFGKPLVSAIGAAGRALPMIGRVANIARIGALGISAVSGGLLSGVLGVAGTAITAVGAALTSPVIVGAAAIAAAGYIAYKTYKYVTRNDVNEFEKIRMMQYGIGTGQGDQKFNSYFLNVEEYLKDKIGYNNGQAYLLDKKVDHQELINIFSIDKEDSEMINRFTTWFSKRFKPFFLTHLTALFSINNKITLSDIKSLKDDEKIKYLKLISFEDGPYSESVSPFKELDNLNTDKTFAINTVKKLIDDITKKQKAATKPGVPPAAPIPEKAKISNVTPKPPEALPKTNVAASTDKKSELAKSLENQGEDGAIKEPKDISNVEGSVKSLGSLKEAAGPRRDGLNAMQYIKLQPGQKLEGMNPVMLDNFKAMAQEYGETTGKSIPVNSGVRTTEEQAELYRRDPKKAAKPGRSLHEAGLAFDAQSDTLKELDEMGLMRKYGFTRPIGGETWHVEPAGIQMGKGSIQEARQNPVEAAKMIQAGIGKGGLGLGAQEGISKGSELFGKRDDSVARSLLTASAQEVKNDAKSDKDQANKTLSAKAEPAKVAPSAWAAGAPAPAQAVKEVSQVAKAPAANDSSIKPNPSVKVNTLVGESKTYSKIDDLPEGESKPKTIPVPQASLGNIDPNNRQEVKSAVETIAKDQNLDPKMMTAFAAKESSLNPNARASTSSASGLFQFTRATWEEQMAKSARKYDIDPNTPPTDVKAATIMASEYVKSNMKILKSVKSDPNLTDVYLTHFLGAGGARKFLSSDPSEIAANVLPAAAKANKSIFYQDNRPLTISEVYTKIDTQLSKTAGDFGISIKSGNQLTAKSITAKAIGTQTPVATEEPSGSKIVPNQTKNQTVMDQKEQVPTPAAKPKPIFTNPAPTVMDLKAPEKSAKAEIDPGTINNIDSTLTQQLDIQKQMLEVLGNILKNVDASKLKEMLDSRPKDTAPPVATQRGNRGGATEMNSALDLRRKQV